MNLKFVKTCDAFPEQYNVFDENGNQVGYVRIRWGKVVVMCPDHAGEIAFHSEIAGFGCLEDHERESVMSLIIDSIVKWIEKESKEAE